MKTFRLFLIALFGWCTVAATAQDMSLDSLKAVADSMPHNAERLQLLHLISKTAQALPDGEVYMRAFISEARLQQNDSLYVIALACLINNYYNNSNDQLDSIRKWTYEALPIAKRHSYWILYFEIQKTLVNAYVYADRFEYALDEADRMCEEAMRVGDINGQLNSYLSRGLAYQGSKRWNEALEMYRQGHILFDQQPPLITRLNLLVQMSDCCVMIHRYSELKQYADELQGIVEEFLKQRPEFRFLMNDYSLLMHCHYIYYYTSIGDFQMAEKHLAEVQPNVQQVHYVPYIRFYWDAIATYQLKRGNRDLALVYNDSAMAVIRRMEMQSDDVITEWRHRGDILFEQQRFGEARDAYRYSIHLQDSLSQYISDRQMEDIRERYQLDKLRLDEARLGSYILWAVLGIILLLIVICISYIVRVNRIRQALSASEKATEAATRITEEANEQKGRFLSSMSHAIRVPLNSVVGFSQLLATDDELDEKHRSEYANIIQRETERLMFLVNSILDLSRLEAGMTKWQMTDYDLVQLCKDAVGSARMQNEELTVELECSVGQCPIHTDCGRMMQLIVSLLAGPVTLPKQKRRVELTLQIESGTACFIVCHSPLADAACQGQDVSLRNDINRLTICYFQGEYEVDIPSQSVRFRLPITV